MRIDVKAEDFYDAIVDLGETIEFLPKAVPDTMPEGINEGSLIQHASIAPNRANKAVATTEGAYLFTGNITFDNMKQQERFVGRYFIRQAQPSVKNILTSVFPENSTPRVGTVQVTECNETVDVISHYEATGEYDEYGSEIVAPVYLHRNIDAFVTSLTKTVKEEEVGALDKTLTYMTVPAEYTISAKNIVMKPSFTFNEITKRNEYVKTPYKVDSIDTSMMDVVDGEIVGTVKCLLLEAQENDLLKI